VVVIVVVVAVEVKVVVEEVSEVEVFCDATVCVVGEAFTSKLVNGSFIPDCFVTASCDVMASSVAGAKIASDVCGDIEVVPKPKKINYCSSNY
jgi:hypothetical protein